MRQTGTLVFTSAEIAAFRSRFLLSVEGGENGSRSGDGCEIARYHKRHDVHSRLVNQGRVLLNLLDGDWL